MNKHCYRVIFNQARGMLMVVAEIIKSHQGASRRSQKAKSTAVSKNTTAALKPVAFMTYIALGLVSVSMASYANTIVVDNNADKAQRPIVMPSANGATQVNIAAPSGAGVSHNKFTQFDVSEKGVILNNSHKDSTTELAGYIKSNDLLIKSGSANVILNEINSKHASQLNGYIEVAGQKAQVVIANAAGITCNGCGFINANRATLTTGKPVLEKGELKGYLVEQGNIAINGKGLNSAKQDYTDLIAQTVSINAGLWANDVKVVAGRNKVNHDVSQITKLTDDDKVQPKLAIDVAALGGMYAGKIQLIGTQAGVGVHNAGQLGASAGSLTITAEGKIVNAGVMQAKGDITLTSQHDITNSKHIYSQKNINITSQKQINHQATMVAQNEITLNAKTIVSTNASSMAAGVDDKGQLTHAGSIQAKATDITLVGKTSASESVHLDASKTVNLDNGTLSSHVLLVTGHDINAKSTTINTQDDVTFHADDLVDTASSTITSHGNINVQAGSIENDNSTWHAKKALALDAKEITNRNADLTSLGDMTQNAAQLDNSSSQLHAIGRLTQTADKIDNHLAQLVSDSDITQTASLTLDNHNGSLSAKGNIAQRADEIDNQHVTLQSEQSITQNANVLNNAFATIHAQQHITQHAAQALDNQQATLTAGGNITLTAPQLKLASAAITAQARMDITAQDVNHKDATLSANDLELTADSLSGDGQLSAARDMTLTLQHDFDNQRRITANRHLSISSKGTITNHQQFLAAAMALSAQQLNNEAQAEISADNLALKADTLINQGLIDGKVVSITTQQLDNKPSGRVYGDNLTIWTTTLNNLGDELAAPVIAARKTFKLAVGTLNNYAHGLLLSLGDFKIGLRLDDDKNVVGRANTINNHASTLESQGNLTIDADVINNINDNIEVKEVLVDDKMVSEWSFIDSPDVRYRPDEVSEYCVGCGGSTNYRELRVNATGKTGTKYNYYQYQQKTYQTQVVTTDPARIISQGNITLNATSLINDNSHINAGQDLIITAALDNRTKASTQRIERVGTRVYRYDYYGKKGRHYNDAERYDYTPLDSISHLDLALSTLLDHTVTQHHDVPSDTRSAVSADVPSTPVVTVDFVSTILPNTALPTVRLYTVHLETSTPYLIETDARFTNQKAWLSSDYLLTQLKADPNNTQKRLGDGYYEQQLIKEQIIGLTGQRYLGDNSDDMAQYQALMNSGVEFANQYGLTVGVSLTAAQMQLLT